MVFAVGCCVYPIDGACEWLYIIPEYWIRQAEEGMESIAFLSDIHGRLGALVDVLADAQERGVDRFVCLGDIGTSDCLEVLESMDASCVFGNWEVSGWRRYAGRYREWVLSWPPVLAEDGWMAAHASPDWPDGVRSIADTVAYREQHRLSWLRLFPSLDRDEEARWRALAAMEAAGVRVAFHGHTHVQEVWRWWPDGRLARVRETEFDLAADGSRYLVGVGSVGNPLDGDGACYAIWEPPGRVRLLRV
ncbi:MAG: metallophosphoesterase family protein [Anaerolineae bacterium]|nr:metallophosphoesterase family protein [Anaerolineae bacterium]